MLWVLKRDGSFEHPKHMLKLIGMEIFTIYAQKICLSKIVSEYDQEIPQSQSADKPTVPPEEPHTNHETPGRQTKQSNQLSLPHQDDCKTRRDIK